MSFQSLDCQSVKRARRFLRLGITRVEIAIVVLVLAGGGWYLSSSIGRSRAASQREACVWNLNEIGRAVSSYLSDHDQHWPYVAKLGSFDIHTPAWKTLPEILKSYTANRTDLFRCPSDRRKLAKDDPLYTRFSRNTTWFETEGTSYEWLWADVYGGKKVGEEALSKAAGFGMGRADQPLLRDFEPFHDGDELGSFNTLFADLKARTARP